MSWQFQGEGVCLREMRFEVLFHDSDKREVIEGDDWQRDGDVIRFTRLGSIVATFADKSVKGVVKSESPRFEQSFEGDENWFFDPNYKSGPYRPL